MTEGTSNEATAEQRERLTVGLRKLHEEAHEILDLAGSVGAAITEQGGGLKLPRLEAFVDAANKVIEKIEKDDKLIGGQVHAELVLANEFARALIRCERRMWKALEGSELFKGRVGSLATLLSMLDKILGEPNGEGPTIDIQIIEVGSLEDLLKR